MRPRPAAQPARTYAVSQVALDPAGRVTAVRWGQVDTGRNAWATPEVVVPVAVAVAALRAGDQVVALFPSLHGHLPDRLFVEADYGGGRHTVVLAGPSTWAREVHDMDRIGGPAPAQATQSGRPSATRKASSRAS